MIDDAAVRAALETHLSGALTDFPISRWGETVSPSGPWIRTRLIREGEKRKALDLTVAAGIFEIGVMTPISDGLEAGEGIAAQVKQAYHPIDQLLGGLVRIEAVELMTARQDFEYTGYTLTPVHVDWKVHEVG